MSRATLDRWHEVVAEAISEQKIDAVPGILVAMALDGYGHEAETLRRQIAAGTWIAAEAGMTEQSGERHGTGELPIEPSEPGWYASADGRLGLGLIFLRLPDLDVPDVIERHGAWRAYTADGDATDCVWTYIAQAGPVVPLTRSTR